MALLARYLRRLGALALYGGAGALVWFVVLAPLTGTDGAGPEEEAQAVAGETAVAGVELPARPESAPVRTPEWAWEMHEWHLTPIRERGPRPADAPRSLPGWYWEWREWRLELTEPRRGPDG